MRVLTLITLLAFSTSALSQNATLSKRPMYCYLADASEQIVDNIGMPVIGAWIGLSAMSMLLPFVAQIVATVYLSKLTVTRPAANNEDLGAEVNVVPADGDNAATALDLTFGQRVFLTMAEYYAPGAIEKELRNNYQLSNSLNPSIFTNSQATPVPSGVSASARDVIGIFIAIIGTFAYVTQQYTKGLCQHEMQGN